MNTKPKVDLSIYIKHKIKSHVILIITIKQHIALGISGDNNQVIK